MQIDIMPQCTRWDPDATGRFGVFGGRFVPETLMAAVIELGEVYAQARSDRTFWEELHQLLTTYVGRPSPL
ncbi:MAG: tryptophan synthase subunit beta, partial [Planctomycetota bacterium]